MSIKHEVKLHEALRHAHGLPHHVRQWLASQPSRQLFRPVPPPATPQANAPAVRG